MAKEKTSKYIRLSDTEGGIIGIADEVVAVIAGYAAMEAEGVFAMAGNITGQLMSRVGMRALSKGVRIWLEAETHGLRIDLAIIVKHGYEIPGVCTQVQEKVKSTVENMTGLSVYDVNIRIVGVWLPSGEQEQE